MTLPYQFEDLFLGGFWEECFQMSFEAGEGFFGGARALAGFAA